MTQASHDLFLSLQSGLNLEQWPLSCLEMQWIKDKRKPSVHLYRRQKHGKVQGIFHCHTDQSDGSDSLEVMVRAAQELGYSYIGISDHSQSAFYAQGLKVDKIMDQAKVIQKLQKKTKIRIFHGIESDILADGSLDYPEDVLAEFDFIVGSIHSRFQMKKNEMTERILRALRHPRLTMWGHPSGRILLGRKPYELDWEECLAQAAQSNVMIELNANPQRLDVDWRLGERLEHYQNLVCINPDAHSALGLQDTFFGEQMAEKAMLSTKQIFNLMGVDEVESFLWKRKKSLKN
jgi:DNA polymerase (family 10)